MDNKFIDNESTISGGSIYAIKSYLKIKNDSFTNTSSYQGGAISIVESNVVSLWIGDTSAS